MAWIDKLIAQGASSVAETRRRLDSWANALTGLGTSRDKTAHMLPGYARPMSPLELENLYATDDIATRIVRAIVDEAFREEWTILPAEEDSEDGINPNERHDEPSLPPGVQGSAPRQGRKEPLPKVGGDGASHLKGRMKQLDAWRKLHDAWIWGRLYGKGAILLGAIDGRPWNEPLDEEAISSFDFLTVLDRRDLTPFQWYADLQDDKFGQIATYYVQPVGVYMGAPYDNISTNPPILVHESRLLIFGGELTNKRQRLANQGCDYSVLQKCFRALQLTNNNWQSASTLLADAGQGVFKIRGLIDMIATNPGIMQDRMALVDMMRSTVRAIILDAGDERSKTPPEDFTRVPTPFTGVPDMLVQTWNRLACAAKMPLMILMGSKPAGLNSDGEQDLEWWYNDVEAEQRSIAQPAIERVLSLIAKGDGIGGEWTARPGALRRLSPAQQAKAFSDRSVGVKNYIDAGVYMPEEVAVALDKDPLLARIDIDLAMRRKMLATSFKAAEDEKKLVNKELTAPAPKPAPPGGAKKGT